MIALYAIHVPQGQARRKLLYIDGQGNTVSGAFRREDDMHDKGDPYQFCCLVGIDEYYGWCGYLTLYRVIGG